MKYFIELNQSEFGGLKIKLKGGICLETTTTTTTVKMRWQVRVWETRIVCKRATIVNTFLSSTEFDGGLVSGPTHNIIWHWERSEFIWKGFLVRPRVEHFWDTPRHRPNFPNVK